VVWDISRKKAKQGKKNMSLDLRRLAPTAELVAHYRKRLGKSVNDYDTFTE
jgi:hypothetical protein